jgi:carbon storage regulator
VLVLSRKKNEEIVIGEGENRVVVTVVEIRGDKVRLGLSGNKDIPIHRAEVYREIMQERAKEASGQRADS